MGAVRQRTEAGFNKPTARTVAGGRARLVAAKLRPPEVPPSHVPRPALCSMLSREGSRLTVLSGPPGAGKTTLLSEWITTRPDRRVAWMSVDPLDDDPVHFFTYLVASLQRHEPTVGVEALDLVVDAEEEAPLASAESLAADLADLDRPITLILDDLHQVHAKHVFRALDHLVGSLSVGTRVILSTRVDPPLALHRLRARGELLELRQSDLQFAEQDAETFFARFGGLRLGRADVRILTERTEGWITGLQLAALSLRNEVDPGAFVRRFAGPNPTASDYLLGEVLERQPSAIQDFLLETSILGELDPALCDAVAGRTDSHQILRDLEAQHLFVLPVELSRSSFRYHQLFAELLESELRARDRVAWREAHWRAARWYSAAGRPSDALDHLLVAEFHQEALELLIDQAPSFYDRVETAEMLKWIERFPEGFFDARPKRMLDLAMVLILGGRYAEAARCLEQVEHILSLEDRSDGTDQVRLSGHWAMWSHVVGDAEGALRWAAKAVDGYSPEADDGYFDRVPDALVRCWGWLDDTHEAWKARQRLYPVPPLAENLARFVTPATLSQLQLIEGHLHEAERSADEALMYANPSGPNHPALAEARLTRAGVHWERDELDQAEREFETSLREAEAHARTAFAVIASLGLVRIWGASGKVDQAFDLLATCRRINRPLALPEPFAGKVDAAEALLLLAQSLPEASRIIERLPDGVETSFLRSRVALARGDRNTASDRLGAMEHRLTTPRRRLQWQLLDARTGSVSSGGSLRAAVEFAAQEGFIRCFVDEGDELLPLLHEQSGAGPAWFVQDLLAALEASAATASSRSDGLVDPLSEREQVVLSYLPSWVSSAEIASELYISLNTLKSHLRSIYRKLGASSRRDAVVQARERGLL